MWSGAVPLLDHIKCVLTVQWHAIPSFGDPPTPSDDDKYGLGEVTVKVMKL